MSNPQSIDKCDTPVSEHGGSDPISLVEDVIPPSLVPSIEGNSQIWPSAVKCEMDIPAWHLALDKAGLLPEFDDVITGFRNGFPQGIPPHSLGETLPYFTPPNHASAWEAKDKIEEKLQKEILAGRMFGPFTHDQVQEKFSFFRSNPLGAVINGDGSLRPTNNLSFPHGNPQIPSVNSFVDPNDFPTTWDDFNVVSSFIRNIPHPVSFAIFDWEKAYRQIPTAMDQWPFLFIKTFDDKLLLDTRITFGGVAGCGSFGRPADAWKQIMLHEFDLITIFRWVDDNLFVKNIDSQTRMEDIVARSNELGVKTNDEKFSPFATKQKYIGFIWNGIDKTVRLPNNKLIDRINQLKAFASKANFSYNDVEIMTGRLNHVSYMLPQLRCYLCSFYRWMKSWVVKTALRELPDDVRSDLERWMHTLLTFKPTRLMPNPAPTEIGWVGDASTGFGIGILIGHQWAQFQLAEEWLQRRRHAGGIAWLETVAIRLGLLMLESLGIKQGKTFIVWTDNTTTENAIRKRKSKDHAVNEEWKIIQDLLVKLQADLEPRRVNSEGNVADGLSRGERDGHDARHIVPVVMPLDLENLLFQVLF
ncbi:uncharacterized protein PGTG_22339 [Puccinia graminis f. sp. tritici CRL 75-36-700-3]|uniref:Reverse transcriptase domain-containing protein n=1 Tax=Puccinia graminis f. sp. tritici (strain CRL 75-36-700-3 / race SCCL) TaxID=418459 RepID=H6QUJ1_PUCGT|nr:uncharacterized protein PGTG_22339 [Puccinia graminis f. sp. tritici CRL 75-36-700-3]EHS64703.1 hypothetical protein PGTG_22339 [Puccinia graminis f. sp. tritici CRL 75-36-700-3]